MSCYVQTPLHLGVLTDRSDIVRRLLEAGASPNATDRHGQTCFHVAVRNGSIDCLRTLIDSSTRPPDVDAMSYDGVYFYNYHISISISNSKGKGRALVIAPQVDTATTEALRYMARTKQRRTYLPYTLSAAAGTHLPNPKGWRVEQAQAQGAKSNWPTVAIRDGLQPAGFEPTTSWSLVEHANHYTVAYSRHPRPISDITSSNRGRFLKFFHTHNPLEMYNKAIVKYPATP